VTGTDRRCLSMEDFNEDGNARRFVKLNGKFGRARQAIPILSAFVITCAGAAICYETLELWGFNLFQLLG